MARSGDRAGDLTNDGGGHGDGRHGTDGRGGEWLVVETDPATVTTREGMSEEHRLIEQSAAEFMDGEVLPALERLEPRTGRSTARCSQKCGALGLLGTNVPESYGGVDLDKVSTMLVSEQIARSASFAATFGAQANLTILPIYMFGTEAQKTRVPAAAGRRRDGRRLLPERIGLGLGRARRQGPGDAPGRRQLRALGREDVDHQRRLRRPLRRLRQGRRRALHRLPRRARLARRVVGQGGAQARACTARRPRR